MLAAVLAMAAGSAVAQPPPPQKPPPLAPETPRSAAAIKLEESKAIAQGWIFLTQGNAAEALAHAESVLAKYPRSPGALNLAVEAAILRSGAAAGLALYERWLGSRSMEEPAIVRRLGHALLWEEASQQQDSAARLAALRELAAAGDADAEAELRRVAATSGGAEARALASLGDQTAIKRVIGDLNKAPGSGQVVLALEALGQSESAAALPVVTAALGDGRSEVRAAAVDALGRIAGADAADRLAAVASNQNESLFPRVRAAAALVRIGDERGGALIQQYATSEFADVRLLAAEALATQPDATWMELTRGLTSAPEPHIRAAAARLIAPHDPELARRVLEPMLADESPVIRELAAEPFTKVVARDLTTLRGLMRHADRLMRIRAAAQILTLTR